MKINFIEVFCSLDFWYKLSIYVTLPEIRHVEYLESITYQFLLFDPTHPATLDLHKGRQPMGQFLFLMAILDDILQCGSWYKKLTILATKHKHLDGFLHILGTCLKYEWIWCSHCFFLTSYQFLILLNNFFIFIHVMEWLLN